MVCYVQPQTHKYNSEKNWCFEVPSKSQLKGRPKTTSVKIVKNDLRYLIDKIVMDQTEQKPKIYVADPS